MLPYVYSTEVTSLLVDTDRTLITVFFDSLSYIFNTDGVRVVWLLLLLWQYCGSGVS